MQSLTAVRDEYEISSDKQRLDLNFIHDYLANQSYWARNISFEAMKLSIDNALCFGLYHKNRQIGFARVITDFATTAYVADVFITESHRGKGLGKWIMDTIVNHPDLQGLRLWLLGTKDAHALYEKYGFKRIVDSAVLSRLMVIYDSDIFNKSET